MSNRTLHMYQFILLICLIFLSVVLLFPLQVWVRSQVDKIHHQIVTDLQKNNNIQVQYESISASIISVILIRNMKVNLPEGEFLAEKIRLFYNPFRYFVSRKNAWGLVSRLHISDGYLKMRFQNDSQGDNQGKPLSIDPWSFIGEKTLSLSSFSIDLRWEEGMDIISENLNATVKNDTDNATLYEFSAFVKVKGLAESVGLPSIESGIISTGRFSSGEASINGQIRFNGLGAGKYSFKPFKADFTYLNDELTVRRIEDEEPVDISLYYTEDSWTLEGKSENLVLERLITLKEDKNKAAAWQHISLSSAFSFSWDSQGTRRHDVQLDAQLDNYYPFGDIRINGAFKGNNSKSFVQSLQLHSGNSYIEYTGAVDMPTLLPEGQLAISISSSPFDYQVKSRFDFKRYQKTVLMQPVYSGDDDLIFEAFGFLIIREEESLTFSLRIIPQTVDSGNSGGLTLDAFVDFSDAVKIKGFLKCSKLNPTYLMDVVGWKALQGMQWIEETALDLSSAFEYNNSSWSFHLDNAELAMGDGSRRGLILRGQGNQKIWNLDLLQFTWNDFDLVGHGKIIMDEETKTLNGNIFVGNELYSLNANWYQDGRIEVHGDRNIRLDFYSFPAKANKMEFTIQDLIVPLPDGELSINLAFQGRRNREGWNAAIHDAQISLIDYSDESELSLEFGTDIRPGEVSFQNILLKDKWGSLWGEGYIKRSQDSLYGEIKLDGPDEEQYLAKIAQVGKLWDMSLDIDEGRLERIGYGDLAGELNVKGKFSFEAGDAKLHINLRTDRASFNDNPLFVKAVVSANSYSIRVRDFDFIHRRLSFEEAIILLDTRQGRFMSTAKLGTKMNETVVSGGFSLVSDFDRTDGLINLFNSVLPNFKGAITTSPVVWNTYTHFPAFTFNFEKNNNELKIQSNDKKILDVSYRFDDGGIHIKSDNPLPFSIQSEGYIKEGIIDLVLNKVDVDSTLINYIMPRDPKLDKYYVLFRQGRFKGNLRISGEVGNPDIDGIIMADQLLVDTPYTYAAIKPASTKVIFSRKRITFRKINVDVGQGIVYGGGYLELENWRISDFDMIYGGRRGADGKPVPAYYRFDDVKIEGSFVGEITMKGAGRDYSLDGNFIFPTIKASLMGWARRKEKTLPDRAKRKKYKGSVDVVLNLVTGNNCTFFLPNEELKIVHATAEVGQSVELNYSSNPELLSISGALKIKRGDIRYFDRNFQVITGILNMNESLQEFNPVLNLRAETRLRDENGEYVDLALVYDAPVLSDFNPKIETNPLRTDIETASLLGQALVPFSDTHENSQGTNSLLSATGSLFEQVGLIQPVEQALRESLNLDIVSVRTNIIGNALAEGLYNNSSSTDLARFLDKTNLFLGKYVSQHIFVSGSVSADYFQSGRDSDTLGNLKFTASLELEMETPLFDILWSYSPNPFEERNFVTDNRISLNRRLTF